MFKGRDRNSLCWCGSGKKFKKCHLGRTEAERPSIGDALKLLESAVPRQCLYQENSGTQCMEPVIRAHSIQRNHLVQIAHNGHVYMYKGHLPTLLKDRSHLPIKKTGISSASTFTGFCKKHDNELFAPIEKQQIEINKEHLFLLAYRTVCRELHAEMMASVAMSRTMGMDTGLDFSHQIAFQGIFGTARETAELRLRDMKYTKSNYDSILISGKYEQFKSVAFASSSKPAFLCSGGVFPNGDFNGAQIQDYSRTEETMHHIAFSIIPFRGCSLIAFSWCGESAALNGLINSLLSLEKTKQSDAISRFAFVNFENISINPIWWESLPKEKQEWVQKHVEAGVFSVRGPWDLIDDGMCLTDWAINAVYDLRE